MSPKNRAALSDRVVRAAEAALAEQQYVAPIDVLLGIGWLDVNIVREWRQGRGDYLEQRILTSSSRVAEALQLFRAWAEAKGLQSSEAEYVARALPRRDLRFGASGAAAVERQYRTHWVSPDLSEKKRERLAEKASRPPELVVIVPLNDEWRCHRCGGTGDLLMMEEAGPACLRCVGLDDLEFLPAGDAALTRHAKAKSARHAVVVRFSRARKRYERQGILVEAGIVATMKQGLGRA